MSFDSNSSSVVSRRRFLGGTAVAAGSLSVLAKQASAQVANPTHVDFGSPATTPWVWPL